MVNYINKADYKSSIKDIHLNQIIDSDDTLLEKAEAFAIETVQSYLRNIYQLESIFTDQFYSFTSGSSYQSGSTVFDGDVVYYATGSTGVIDSISGSTLVARDIRNPVILTIMIDLALYELHSRINPNNIPQLRELRKADCMEMLHKINQGKITLNLPKKETGSFVKPTIVGKAKIDWGY